jgi:hypothetical protein
MDTSKLLALVKNKQQALQRHGRTVKLKPGKNRVVLLPGWRETEREVFWREFGQHYIKDTTGTVQAVYVCSHRTDNVPCEICDELARASKLVDDATRETLAEAKANQVYLLNVLLPESEQPNTPQILEVPGSVFNAVLQIVGSWQHRAFEMELEINKDGKGLNTKYTAVPSPNPANVPADALTKLNNLDEYVKQTSDEGKRRAQIAVKTVAGLLAAPGASDAPRTAAPALPASTAAATAAAAPAAFPAETVAAAPVAATAAPAAAATVDLDAELDELLKQ